MSQAIADPYWSRPADHWETVDREDPVVWGDTSEIGYEHGLKTEDVATYERNGFHHAPTLFSADEAAERLAAATT